MTFLHFYVLFIIPAMLLGGAYIAMKLNDRAGRDLPGE
jgi:hypothetical protein